MRYWPGSLQMSSWLQPSQVQFVWQGLESLPLLTANLIQANYLYIGLSISNKANTIIEL